MDKEWVMANGPWNTIGHIVALEPCRPNFSARVDYIFNASLWVGSLTCQWSYGARYASSNSATVGQPKFIDNCTKEVLRDRYAQDFIQVDLSKRLRPPMDLAAKGRRRRQPFKYQNIPLLCYL